jgi:putative lumazine-binding protein
LGLVGGVVCRILAGEENTPELTMTHLRRAVVFFAALGSLAQAAAAQSSGDAKSVEAVIKRLFDGMRARDTAMMRSTMDSSARLIGVDTAGVIRVTPVDRWFAGVARPRPQIFDERIYDPQIQIDQELAQVWVKYDFFLGDTFSHCGIDAFMLSKRRDGWKITQIADTRKQGSCGTPGSSGK